MALTNQFRPMVQAWSLGVVGATTESFIEGLEELNREGMDEDDLEALSNALKLTYDIARMCSIKVTMAIDLKNQKQGTIERKNVKRFMEKFLKDRKG